MLGLNLLPWREQLREQQKQQFFIVLGITFLLAVLIIISMHIALAVKLKQQVIVNNMIQHEINIYAKRINAIKDLKKKKDTMIARLHLIQELQASRPLTVKFYDELVRVMPQGVYLNELKREDNNIIIQGKAESNTRVSELMRNIEKSYWLTMPALTEIKRDKDDSQYQREFTLKLKILTPEMQYSKTQQVT